MSHIDSGENYSSVRPLLKDKELYSLTSHHELADPAACQRRCRGRPHFHRDGLGIQSQLTIVSDGLPAMPRGVYAWDSLAKSVTGTAQLQVYWILKSPFFDWPPVDA
jgi:hypothetical protein